MISRLVLSFTFGLMITTATADSPGTVGESRLDAVERHGAQIMPFSRRDVVDRGEALHVARNDHRHLLNGSSEVGDTRESLSIDDTALVGEVTGSMCLGSVSMTTLGN
jgi:hypothetical protein